MALGLISQEEVRIEIGIDFYLYFLKELLLIAGTARCR